RVAFFDPFSERLNIAIDRSGDVSESAGDDLPILRRMLWKHVKAHPNVLRGAGKVVQVPLGGAGVEEVELKIQFPQEVGPRHPIDLVGRFEGIQFRSDTGEEFSFCFAARGREVAEFGFVAVESQEYRNNRVEF